MKVICAKKTDECPKQCQHSHPHDPVYDRYGYEVIGDCDKLTSRCGYHKDAPLCQCHGVENEN